MKDRGKKDHLSNSQYPYLHQAGHKDRAMTKKSKIMGQLIPVAKKLRESLSFYKDAAVEHTTYHQQKCHLPFSRKHQLANI